MPYVQVADPLLNSDKSARSTDIKQIRDNQDFFNDQINSLIIAAGISEQSISDDFLCKGGGSALGIGAWWDVLDGGVGASDVVSEHQLRCLLTANGTANFAGVSGADDKMRIDKSEEYVAIMEVRVKRVSGDADDIFFGWQDVTLKGGSTQYSDVTDCVGVIHDAGGNWIARSANGGTASTVGPFATATDWNIIRLEFTCSATAGSRKCEVYLADSLQGTLQTDANMPAGELMPCLGLRGNGAGAVTRDIRFDYAIFTVSGRPLAA